MGATVSGGRQKPSPQTAILAVTVAGGILFFDLARNGRSYSEQAKLHSGLAFGVGAVILIGLAEAVPELGVPLSVLLLLVVAVGRSGAVTALARMLSTVTPDSSGGGKVVRTTAGTSTHTQGIGGKL